LEETNRKGVLDGEKRFPQPFSISLGLLQLIATQQASIFGDEFTVNNSQARETRILPASVGVVKIWLMPDIVE
jgi:hypothetical protein